MKNRNDYMKIKEAAEFLKVTTTTLRNWDKQGRLVAYRHPMNNYRMYKREQIDEIVNKLGKRRDIPQQISVELIEEA